MKKQIIIIMMVLITSFCGGLSAHDATSTSKVAKVIATVTDSNAYQYTASTLHQAYFHLKNSFFSKDNILLQDRILGPVIVIGALAYLKYTQIINAKKKKIEELKKTQQLHAEIA